jgi:rhamnosyl/mannosyltransferase
MLTAAATLGTSHTAAWRLFCGGSVAARGRQPHDTRGITSERSLVIRILHVAKTAMPFTFGGLEETIRQISLSLGDGYAFETACARSDAGQQPPAADHGHVHTFRTRINVSTCPVAPSMIGFLRAASYQYDVIHFHAVWPFAETVDSLVHFGPARRVVTYHADVVGREPLNSLYRPWLRRFLERSDRVVATSDAYIDSSPVLSRLSTRPDVIPLGLSPETYPKADPDRVTHWRARLPEPLFLFVGALRKYKGLEELVDAVAGLPVQLAICGEGVMGDRLRARIAERGLTNVHLLGRVDEADKASLLGIARAVVLPSTSRAEAFGIALLEGAMFGRPLISTELGTATSVVNVDGETGFAVPPSDVGALRAAIERLCDRDRAEAMGRAAKARFEARFRGDRVAVRYGELYASLGYKMGQSKHSHAVQF